MHWEDTTIKIVVTNENYGRDHHAENDNDDDNNRVGITLVDSEVFYIDGTTKMNIEQEGIGEKKRGGDKAE